MIWAHGIYHYEFFFEFHNLHLLEPNNENLEKHLNITTYKSFLSFELAFNLLFSDSENEYTLIRRIAPILLNITHHGLSSTFKHNCLTHFSYNFEISHK
jgi:CRISPR/Cas system-associated endonuclease/helicase Cas3